MHHVISNVEQPRVENGSVKVENLLSSVIPLQLAKVLLTEVHQLLMLNISSANNNQILSVIHPLVEINNHIPGYLINILNNAKNWQAHHMISINIKVYILHQRFKSVVICGLELLPDCVFLHLNVIVEIRTVCEHIAKNTDGVGDVIFETERVIKGEFSRSVGVQLSATVFNFGFESVSGSDGAAFEVQVLQEMRFSAVFWLFVSGTGSDEDSDGGNFRLAWLRHDFDPV